MTRLTANKCLEGWTNCLEQLNVKADIVFLGDSLTYYGRFSDIFPDYRIANLGLRGDDLKGVIGRLEQIKALQPSMLFLMIGLNDIGVTSLEVFYEDYASLTDQLLGILPAGRLVLQSIIPVNSTEFNISLHYYQVSDYNSVIKRIAEDNNLAYLDLYELYSEDDNMPANYTEDGIHLKAGAYSLWYDALKTVVDKQIG